MDDKLTIFYNKRTGSIKELCGGEQDMGWFGDEQQDFEQIFDYIHVDFDNYIIENFINMEVVDGEVKLIQQEVPDKYL
jgi:hypothetical protein